MRLCRGTKPGRVQWHQRTKQQRRAIKGRQRQRDALIKELKAVPCKDCGQEYLPEAMDFDHVPGRGGKLGSVPSRPTLRAILDEARKCDVVCANCHRVRTLRRRQVRRSNEQERGRWLDGLAEAVEREREALRQVAAQETKP